MSRRCGAGPGPGPRPTPWGRLAGGDAIGERPQTGPGQPALATPTGGVPCLGDAAWRAACRACATRRHGPGGAAVARGARDAGIRLEVGGSPAPAAHGAPASVSVAARPQHLQGPAAVLSTE